MVQARTAWAAAVALLFCAPVPAQPGTSVVPDGVETNVKAVMNRAKEAYDAGNTAIALAAFRQAAAFGEVDVPGGMYGTGRDVTRDYGQALSWFLKAAQGGNSQIRLRGQHRRGV